MSMRMKNFWIMVGGGLRKGIVGVSTHSKKVKTGCQAPVHAAGRLLNACCIGFRHVNSPSIAWAAVAGRPSLVDELVSNGALLEDIRPNKW